MCPSEKEELPVTPNILELYIGYWEFVECSEQDIYFRLSVGEAVLGHRINVSVDQVRSTQEDLGKGVLTCVLVCADGQTRIDTKNCKSGVPTDDTCVRGHTACIGAHAAPTGKGTILHHVVEGRGGLDL